MAEETDSQRSERELAAILQEKSVEVYGTGATVEKLTKLSMGASRECWAFDVSGAGNSLIPLILKRDPVNYADDGTIAEAPSSSGMTRQIEGQLIIEGGKVGVPVPNVPFFLEETEQTTAGFISERLEGETLGRRILRDEAYAEARPKLAYQCGHAAARMHSIPLDVLPDIKTMTAEEHLQMYYDQLCGIDHPYPGFEYGYRWLKERVETAGDKHAFVHGDYRNGNIIVNSEGLAAVLDWELGHTGNPYTDLGWICVPSWRYGHYNKRVGGFGDLEDMLAGYEAGGGGVIDPEIVRYWEVFGTLRWGIMCIGMGFSHIDGPIRSLEKAAIGRRAAETEYDLLRLVD
jgi:aminoglycoside phosphotransferase (APT) family kinase protein